MKIEDKLLIFITIIFLVAVISTISYNIYALNVRKNAYLECIKASRSFCSSVY